MGIKNWLGRLLRSPSAHPGDPEGWVGNQSAHALIVGGGLVLAFWWAAHPALWAALIYAVWEVIQLRYGAGWLDCLTDWLFVTSGAVLIHAGLTGDTAEFALALGGLICAGLAGAIRRL